MKNTMEVKIICLISILTLLNISGCTKFAKIDSKQVSQTLVERPASLQAITDTSGKTGRVVIRIKQPVEPEKSTKINILKRLQQSYDRELGKLPGMVVDRSLSKSISSEIELSEIYGKNSGRQDADYVLMIALDDYISDQSTEDTKSLFTRKDYTSCKFEASYKGWVRVLTIPALEKVAQWEIEEDKSGSFDESSASRCHKGFRKQLQTLQSKMIDDTVCSSKSDYLNALSPTGHILSIKHDKENILLETSLGSSINANKNDKVYFYHELSAKPYAEGVITSLSPKKAWVKLDSLQENEQIYLHDWVRPHYSQIMNTVKCLF